MVARTWADSWSAPQIIAPDALAARLTALPDGGRRLRPREAATCTPLVRSPARHSNPRWPRRPALGRRRARAAANAAADMLLVWPEPIDPRVCDAGVTAGRRPVRLACRGDVSECAAELARAAAGVDGR